jgi:hypothetical protein
MGIRTITTRRIFSIALTWSFLWLLFAALTVTAIGILDPDSIDEGEVEGAIFILGPMGILTGLAFAFLFSIGREAVTGFDLSLFRSLSLGFVGSAIVQLVYLGHGDAGLAANIGMALVFCAFGGFISVIWLFLQRRRFYSRKLHSSRG